LAAAGELHHHLGVGQGREAQPAEFLRDDHAEEALVLDELPNLGRQIVQLVGDLPVVHHPAQLFDRAVEEGLLLGGQLGLGQGQQFAPIRTAAEQIAVPPHRAGVQRLLLGLRHLRQHLAEPAEQRIADERAPQRRHQQHARRSHEDRPQDAAPHRRQIAAHGRPDQKAGRSARPHPARRAEVGQTPQQPGEGRDP
jgi:hypothetical protein